MDQPKVILIIMDGWGLAEDPSVSAIKAAQTPYYDHATANFPMTRLEASGLAVGLPTGQMGNSEVGHTNIGAGRIIYQDLMRINRALESDDFANNAAFQELVAYCKQNQKPLHLMGLLSDGGVHSSIDQLKGIVRLLATMDLPGVYLHAFMDGRDTSPTRGKAYLEDIEATMTETGTGKVASVIGRYYAMDRDKRWPRVKLAYDLITKGTGTPFSSSAEAIADAYAAEETDEFVKPRVITQEDGSPVATLQAGDAVLFFNFRPDRGRQLTHVFTQEDMAEHEMQTLDLHYATLTPYDSSFKGVKVLFTKDNVKNGLGEQLSLLGKTQTRIAETEKYPHVTYFFNGGREKPMEGEKHLLCPSPKVATYDLQPEMSAFDIRDTIIKEIEENGPDFICLNFANPDMVGHTGVFEAAVKACETVDACTKAVVEAANAAGYIALITADHGNADRMRNPDGSPHTAHTTVEVPLFLVDPENRYSLRAKTGKLGDLAPTILDIMGLARPEEMDGDILAIATESTVHG